MSTLVRSSALSESKDSSWPPRVLLPVGILGGTGLVGRMLARSLCDHPFLCCGPIVGSKRSAGQMFEEVWKEKEDALEQHYGKELWQGDRNFPSSLRGAKVVDVDELITLGCRLVISAIAPRLGFLEDKLKHAGITVISISPYKRQEGALCVLEANHAELSTKLQDALQKHYVNGGLSLLEEKGTSHTFSSSSSSGSPESSVTPVPSMLPLVKSPNCVCCGTSTVLSGLASIFGTIEQVSVTTFQSLSGRGDSKYPSELVVGNVYPLRSTSEPTEALICEELVHVLGNHLKKGRESVSVGAYRVSVQRGHLIDVRLKFEDDSPFKGATTEEEKIQFIESIYKRLENWSPILNDIGETQFKEHLPSVPKTPIQCCRDAGAPRPKSHHLNSVNGNGNGYHVTVGNVGINDGPYDLVLTLVVDNLVKGALGAALQLLEYTLMVTKARE
jgi:aspartate-semialdehyde dehydrogenase